MKLGNICEYNLKFNRNKTNLAIAKIIYKMIMNGDSRLKEPVKRGDISIVDIFDAIRSQACIRIKNYSPDKHNQHLKQISLGPSYLEQQISRLLDKAVEKRLIPYSYLPYVRNQIGLDKENQKPPVKESIEIQDLPEIKVSLTLPALRQSEHYSCGATALQMIMAYYGQNIREQDIIDKLGVQKESGVKLSIIQKVAEELGFITGRKTIKLEQLVDNIYNEIPQIIAIKKKEKDYHHFVIPVGTYDKGIIVRDPAKIEYGYIPLEEFKQRCYGNDGKFLSLSLKLDKNPEYSNNGASRS
jgi:predicted double-glycine peptidase